MTQTGQRCITGSQETKSFEMKERTASMNLLYEIFMYSLCACVCVCVCVCECVCAYVRACVHACVLLITN